jgi:hypothetical protein
MARSSSDDYDNCKCHGTAAEAAQCMQRSGFHRTSTQVIEGLRAQLAQVTAERDEALATVKQVSFHADGSAFKAMLAVDEQTKALRARVAELEASDQSGNVHALAERVAELEAQESKCNSDWDDVGQELIRPPRPTRNGKGRAGGGGA